MLSGLVASPTLDLGGRSRNASSKLASATVDPTAPASGAPTDPVTRAAISIEYASLRHDKHCPTGMYVTPSSESMLIWDAVLFVHKGDYAGSVLKFVMVFPDNYPDRPPTVRFVTDVFHPLVASQTGMLNLTARFRPWRPKEHHVHDVLYFVKTAFKERALDKLDEMDVVNKEAFKLHTENRSSFTALAQQSSQLSRSPSALYDTPSSRKAYSFRFAPTELEQVNKTLETLSIQIPSGYSS
ncbi:UBC-like protein [Boletus coccyginus]|nr:UBC-like protein [Boletus coccyginus]